MTEVDDLRDPAIRAFALPNVDRPYRFFCDETNNVRRLHLTGGRLNITRPEIFVLAGIVQRQPATPIDVAPLHRRLGLQPNVAEIKLKHIGSGSFLELLASDRLRTFLRWLTEEGMLIHYHATDVMYWSIVDIVDSILADANADGDAPQLFEFAPMAKDSLYALLRDDVDRTAEMLGRYRYPNVGADRRAEFMQELLYLLEESDGTLEHFEHYMLKGLLQMGRKAALLPFIEDETPDVLIATFGHFFLHRLALFKVSEHVLDEERVIERFLDDAGLTDGGAPFRNHRFADSRIEPGIQLSDVVAGLLGKAFTYANRTPSAVIEHDLAAMPDASRASLTLLARLIDRSTEESPAFAHWILSLKDQHRAAMFLG